MRIANRFHQLRGYKVIAPVVIVILSTFIFISNANAAATNTARDGRLITIHDRGSEKVILTQASTLKDALQNANIPIAPGDQVEPQLDSELIATDYTVNIYRARPVLIIDGAVKQKIMTAAQTAEGISAAAQIPLRDEDKTQISASGASIEEGAGIKLTIDRATEFTLTLYGSTTTAYSQEATVGEMLKKKNITLGPNDSLSVNSDTPLTAGMSVAIWRNGIQTATVEEQINFPTRQVKDADQPASYKKIQTPGTKGRKNVTYEITMQNGKEVSRKMLQSVTIEEPKEQVEIVGAKPSFGGDFAAALAKLRACESGGNYANKKNPLYRGAYQFSYSTWGNKYGIYDPADASAAQQDQAARELYVRRGWQPWPHCGSGLPDTYR